MDKIGTKRNYYCCCFCLVVLFVCLLLETCCWVFPLGVEGRYWCPICGGPEEGRSYVGEGWVRLVMFKGVDLKHYPLWLVGGFWEVWWWQWQWLLFLLLWVRGIFV